MAHRSPNLLPRSRPHGPGFTLVELLVVVAVITVLIALLLPSLTRAKRQAAALACAANMKQIGIALNGYMAENNQWVTPFAWQWNGAWIGEPYSPDPWNNSPVPRGWYRWYTYLRPYVDSYKVFNCPTLTAQAVPAGGSWGTGQLGGTRTAVGNATGDYGYGGVRAGLSSVGCSCNYAMAPTGYQESRVRPSSIGWEPGRAKRLPTILDIYHSVTPQYGSPFYIMDGVERVYPPTDSWFGTNLNYRYVHPGPSANVLFFDGRVERHVKADFAGGTLSIDNTSNWLVGVRN